MTEHAHGVGLIASSGPLDLLAFLSLGLLGSAAHCVGMCAPFAMLVSRRYGVPLGQHAPLVAQLWYSAGRLTTYATLGVIAGGLGGLVQLAGATVGLQRAAALLAGAVLVVWGVTSLFPGLAVAAAGSSRVSRVVSHLHRRMPAHPLTMGLMLGLLPCGLLYTALVAAITTGSALAGGAAMAVFGLGTVPALMGVSLADTLLLRRRPALNRIAQLFVLAMGFWYLWRGLVPPPH
ncbi:MAG: sulfite exporter TauE/SafE family protein [Acidobacteria bacterium]|nr:sulfite exporter TauE/SafE family protein [Acidobacteriota bacterium]